MGEGRAICRKAKIDRSKKRTGGERGRGTSNRRAREGEGLKKNEPANKKVRAIFFPLWLGKLGGERGRE